MTIFSDSSSSPHSWLLLPPYHPATSRNTRLPAPLPQTTRHQTTRLLATPPQPTPHQPTPPAYPAPAYPAPAYPAPAYPAPAYPAPAYNKDNKYADITITSQSDERNLDGSTQWSYAQSDYTTREESQVQKKMQGVTYDSYGKESYGEVLGNTNKGSSYWVSPEGQKFTLTWAADEAGFQPKGDHLPVAPVHEYELPVAPVHEYELPVAPVHIPFNGKGYKIY
ncbi:hypothetical protein OUZ56_010952 [Daphnia magna]|uniref:Cuticle protein n=3 Tax=Daphnia magna TaxID=35525 RepID=A0ABQ9YYV5_9CRUS|nr:hypothetical protein OUZ56_010952 [Daphnia magna]